MAVGSAHRETSSFTEISARRTSKAGKVSARATCLRRDHGSSAFGARRASTPKKELNLVNPHLSRQRSPYEARFPLSACSTSSPKASEAGISLTATKEQSPLIGIGRSSSIRQPRSRCCRFRSSNKSALVVTRILMAPSPVLICRRLGRSTRLGRLE